jgi:hypothetical protein
MISQGAAGAWYKSLVSWRCLDPEPEWVVSIEYLDYLSFGDKHLIFLLGFKVMDHHELLEVATIK